MLFFLKICFKIFNFWNDSLHRLQIGLIVMLLSLTLTTQILSFQIIYFFRKIIKQLSIIDIHMGWMFFEDHGELFSTTTMEKFLINSSYRCFSLMIRNCNFHVKKYSLFKISDSHFFKEFFISKNSLLKHFIFGAISSIVPTLSTIYELSGNIE